MHGDSAPLHGFLKAARGTRIDLLFTMSDITRAGSKPGARICVVANEIKAQHQAGGAVWWSQTGSNRRPPACKAGALPTELWPLASQLSLLDILEWTS